MEILTGSEITEDLHDGVGISLGPPVGGLNLYDKDFCNMVYIPIMW